MYTCHTKRVIRLNFYPRNINISNVQLWKNQYAAIKRTLLVVLNYASYCHVSIVIININFISLFFFVVISATTKCSSVYPSYSFFSSNNIV